MALAIPALGFGTLIPDLTDTENAVLAAVEVGFRQFDCAERYRNENAIGEAFQQMFQRQSQTRGCVYRHETVEHQSSPGAGQTSL